MRAYNGRMLLPAVPSLKIKGVNNGISEERKKQNTPSFIRFGVRAVVFYTACALFIAFNKGAIGYLDGDFSSAIFTAERFIGVSVETDGCTKEAEKQRIPESAAVCSG